MSMLRTIKPKNARVKRALEKREPQAVENEKTAIFVRGSSTSDRVRLAMKDLYALKRPQAINFSRKNDIHPLDDASSLEFFAQKNDASLFVTGLHSKKRPHDLIFTRMFDGRVLDQLEFGIEDFRGMDDFQSPKSALGARPLMLFHGDLFDTHPTLIHAKSTLLDFYNGHPVPSIPIIALEHVISLTHGPLDPSNPDKLPLIHFRVFTLKLLPSRRFELTEMGPRIDWSVRRVQRADEEVMKVAMKRAKVSKGDVEKGLGRKRKNVETDELGDKVGKIHLKRQDLGKLQSRKMKGLKVHKEGKVGRKSEGEAGAVAAGEDMEIGED